MKKIVITIFSLPQDLDNLSRVLIELNNAAKQIDGSNFHFYISLSTDDFLVDWEQSKIDKSYIEDKFHYLKKYTDWTTSTFQIRDDILGALSNKIYSYEENPNATHFLWLDTDICFDKHLLSNIVSSIDKIKETDKYLITPQIVKYWDKTFDCIVNEKFIYEPYGYCHDNNPFQDCGVHGITSLKVVTNPIEDLPTTKFGAGWATCISKPLLDEIPIPKSMGHYGPDDTYLMYAIDKSNSNIKQYMINNYVVCENFKYNLPNKSIVTKDIKDYFKKIAEDEMNRILGTMGIY
jgi:hypothetical protein